MRRVERYTIRIEGTDPLTVDETCSARDAGGSANAVTVRFDDTKPRPFDDRLCASPSRPRLCARFDVRLATACERASARSARVAGDADVIVAFVGLSAWLEGEEMDVKVPGFAGRDRTDIRLPAAQRDLLAALEATGKPVVDRPAKRIGRCARAKKVARRMPFSAPGTAASRAVARSRTG